MEYIHLSHCVYYCDYHIVIVTKYRREIFNEGIFAYLEKKLIEDQGKKDAGQTKFEIG
jgi:REP element-mobilizing transposase RayT